MEATFSKNSAGLALRKKVRPWVLTFVGTATANIGLLWWTEQDSPILLFQASIGLWIVWLSYFLWNRSNELPIILPIYCGVYFLNYLAPVFNSDFLVKSSPVSNSAIHAATTLALVGQILFFGAFVLFPIKRIRPPRLLNLPVDLKRSITGLFLIFMFGGFLKVVTGFKDFPLAVAQIVLALSQMGLIAMGGLFLLHLRRELTKVQTLTLFGTIGLMVSILFVSGYMALPAGILASLFIVYLIEKRKVPLTALILCLVPMILFSRIKGEFRAATWGFGEQANASFFDSASTLVDLSEKAIAPSEQRNSSREAFLARMDHLTAFGLAIEWTPSRIPYWGGETYLGLLTSPIPRLLWPDKPQVAIGQEYGHRYWYLDRSDHVTSVNLEQTVEMFINFGRWGVIVGMLLIGVLYRAFFAMLDVRNDLSLLMGAAIIPGLMVIETNFAMIHGALIQLLLFWVVAFFLCLRLGLLKAPKGT